MDDDMLPRAAVYDRAKAPVRGGKSMDRDECRALFQWKKAYTTG
jgi:hypothetical protein